MTQYVQERVEKLEKPVTAWILLSIIISFAFVYAYFVNGAVANIVSAKEMRTQISTLTSSLGELEANYLAAKSDVNLEYAHSLGLVDSASSIVYISKTTQASLSFNR
jgi:hypothetical protein